MIEKVEKVIICDVSQLLLVIIVIAPLVEVKETLEKTVSRSGKKPY